jgi:hypothetical protein
MISNSAAFALLAMVLMGAPVHGEKSSASLTLFYEKAIAQEILNCQEKANLQSSISPNLRIEGHRAACKELFLKTNRDRLLKKMIASHLEPKIYKVHLFLNEQFYHCCYAHLKSGPETIPPLFFYDLN